MTRKYPSYLYRDPLLKHGYLTNHREGTPIHLSNIIDRNVYGDPILQTYINRLDEEILGNKPEGLPQLADAMWEADNWNQLGPKIMNEARKHGWCVVQFYEDNPRRWEVFNVHQFTDYLKETDEDGKIIAVGMKFQWSDYLGNSFHEQIRFDDDYTFLIKYKEGDGMRVFAFPDLTEDIMTLVFEFRQIRGQMSMSASKPSFPHFIYGESAGDDEAQNLDNILKHVSTSAGIGAPESVLKEINTIKNENINIIEPAYERQLKLIAGATRLPVSYFVGERGKSSGFSDIGEKTELVRVRRKKEYLFNWIKPYIEQMFETLYNISINITLPQEATIDGQQNQRTNSREETQ
jgi:hypothetical protein